MMAIDEHRRMAMEGSNHAIGPVLAAFDPIAATLLPDVDDDDDDDVDENVDEC